MEIKRIDTIAKGKFEGYIWESDKTDPTVLINEDYDGFDANIVTNPFVIEALLYNDVEKNLTA